MHLPIVQDIVMFVLKKNCVDLFLLKPILNLINYILNSTQVKNMSKSI